MFNDNAGGGPYPSDVAPNVQANKVRSSLGCVGNHPAPINDGHLNKVGSESGQCVGL